MNPARIVFRVRCFGRAPGCSSKGAPTDEYSWFAGYAWRFALCAECGTHVGWHFSRVREHGSEDVTDDRGGFTGLIRDRIVEETDGE